MFGGAVAPADEPLVRLRPHKTTPWATGLATLAYEATFALDCALESVLQLRKNYSTHIFLKCLYCNSSSL